MSTHINTAAGLPITVRVQCEGCNEIFEARSVVMGTGMATQSIFNPQAHEQAKEEAQKELQKNIEKIVGGRWKELKISKSCPHCGYIQSWMIPENRRRNQNAGVLGKILFGLLALAAPIACGIVGTGQDSIKAGLTVGILVFLLAVGVPVGKVIYARTIYHPNKKWLAAKGLDVKQAPASRGPIELTPVPRA